MRRGVAALAVASLVAAAAALATAPALMPVPYSWVRQMISETSAQGLAGAWLGRSGFVLSAAGVLLVTVLGWAIWSPPARAMHAAYGVLLLALAAFSRRPWTGGGQYDTVEDIVHSALAPVAGAVFVAAVVALTIAHKSRAGLVRTHDWGTVGAVVVLGLVMASATGVAGLAQRLMAFIGIAWYAVEALRAARETSVRHPMRPRATGTG